jgi:hypothetical protein
MGQFLAITVLTISLLAAITQCEAIDMRAQNAAINWQPLEDLR